MVLIIDNYDSFTFNLVQYFMELSQKVHVVRNDEINTDEIERINPSHIVISPGPGRPEDAGISVNTIKQYSGRIPILGVCLGHQAIGYAFGGNIINAAEIMHGKTSRIKHDNKGIFTDIPDNFEATRYHSLVIDRNNLPSDLEISATVPDGDIMGIRHKSHLTEGIQVHPESILTKYGREMLKNFLEYKYVRKAEGIIIREALKKLLENKDIGHEIARDVMNEIMDGMTTDAQISSFLTALRIKGETIEEITALAGVMREKSIKITPVSGNLVDTCGTGGDGSGTFNISTAAALIAAGAGVKIAKHGNRSVSSRSGSADVLEALNVKIDIPPQSVADCIDEVGIGFLFAPKLHPAMKYAAGPRKEIGIRTVFNILGPLTNPACAQNQVMGVYDASLVEKLAHVLLRLGIKRGYVIASDDGLDEVSVSSPTLIASIKNNSISIDKFIPESVGISLYAPESVTGSNASGNAAIIREILESKNGPCRDIACLNAAFAISAGMDISVNEGIKLAYHSVDSGKARSILTNLVDYTNSI